MSLTMQNPSLCSLFALGAQSDVLVGHDDSSTLGILSVE